jgi:hypothetical protein
MQPLNPSTVGAKHICPLCSKEFTEKRSVDRHLANQTCQASNPNIPKPELIKAHHDQLKLITDLQTSNLAIQATLQVMQDSIKKLETGVVLREPSITNNNQNLNVLCLGSKDNLLDILANRDGLYTALIFMKGCVLSRLAGDCRILEKAYKLETEQAAIMFVNKSKTKFVYYDERQKRTVESNAKVLAKKLTDILQRSYLKGMESFRTSLSGENNGSDRPELEPYDLQLWNEHIHELQDEKYQKNMLNSLKIPQEPPRE